MSSRITHAKQKMPVLKLQVTNRKLQIQPGGPFNRVLCDSVGAVLTYKSPITNYKLQIINRKLQMFITVEEWPF
jgi:hypothetical protein